MKLDGIKISQGMELHCLAYGLGNVERIDGDVATVLFKSGKRYNYKGGTNVSFVDRTLYIREPLIITSDNDDQAWHDMKTALVAVASAMRSIRKTMEQ